MRLPWSKTYEVTCCDGSKRTVYRNIDDALPFAVSTPSVSLKANADAKSAVSGGLSGDYQRKVDGLLVGLDGKNNALMEKFRAVYLVFKSDPCGNGDYLKEQVTRLTEQHDRLSSLEVGVGGLVDLARSKPDQAVLFTSAFRELAGELAPFSPELRRQIASMEVEQARLDAARWIRTARDESGEEDR